MPWHPHHRGLCYWITVTDSKHWHHPIVTENFTAQKAKHPGTKQLVHPLTRICFPEPKGACPVINSWRRKGASIKQQGDNNQNKNINESPEVETRRILPLHQYGENQNDIERIQYKTVFERCNFIGCMVWHVPPRAARNAVTVKGL